MRSFHGIPLSVMLLLSIAVPYLLFGWEGAAGAAIGFVVMYIVMFLSALLLAASGRQRRDF